MEKSYKWVLISPSFSHYHQHPIKKPNYLNYPQSSSLSSKHYLLLKMQFINIFYFIITVTAVAIPATTESEASSTSVDSDPVFPTAQILHTTLTDCFS